MRAPRDRIELLREIRKMRFTEAYEVRSDTWVKNQLQEAKAVPRKLASHDCDGPRVTG